MALSGSYDFTLNRDEIIENAMQDLGVLDDNESPTASELTKGARKLNLLLKSLPNYGLDLAIRKRYTLFLTNNQEEYTVGTDRFVDNYVETELAADAVMTDTTIEVENTFGISAADKLGIVVDDGNINWHTVDSASGTTITLGNGGTVGDAASTGNKVFAYTSLANKPFRLLYAQTRTDDAIDTEIQFISRQEYETLSQKDSAGAPTCVHYEPDRLTGKIFVWPTQPEEQNIHRIEFVGHAYAQDVNAATDDLDFPQEALLMLSFGLSWLLSWSYGLSKTETGLLKAEFFDQLRTFLDSNVEHGELRFMKDERR